MKLAVVTTDAKLIAFVRACFPSEYQCIEFDSALELTSATSCHEFSGVLLDAKTSDALSALVNLRSRQVPLVVFRVQPESDFMTRYFEAGAEEVALLPLNATELYVRTMLALKRFHEDAPDHPSDELEFAGYRLDRRTSEVSMRTGAANKVVRLTAREFAIVWQLFSRPGRYLSRRQMASTIWGTTEDVVGRTLEQHIYKLRKKLMLKGENGARIRTIYAHGYQVETI